jgi:hypothetical protein
MKSSTFYCPHCQANLTKSAAAQVLGEADSYFAFGAPVVTCPACGGAIDAKAMIEGKLDKRPGAKTWVKIGTFAVFLLAMIVCMGEGLSFWVALIISLVAGGLFNGVLGQRAKKRTQHNERC